MSATALPMALATTLVRCPGTAVAGTGGPSAAVHCDRWSNDADAVQGFTLTVTAPSFRQPDNITCIEVTANCDFDVSARLPATRANSVGHAAVTA